MKRMKIITLVFVLVLMLVSVIPVGAITDGQADGNGHPFVGLMVAKNADGDPLWRCSGTLISETVFLTAGHCTESPAATAEIWFDADLEPTPADYGYPSTGEVSGTTHTHPDFNFPYYDVGVVVLDAPVVRAEYGKLPAVDSLNQYKTKRGLNTLYFTAVGYGLQASFPDAAGWKDSYFKTRMVAYPKLIQINVPGFTGDFSLLLSNNANTGGTCFGDSGGPNFLRGTNVVAGVTSYGINGNCAGTGGVYRMDQQSALDFVNDFLNP
jgi:hypothetical protein